MVMRKGTPRVLALALLAIVFAAAGCSPAKRHYNKAEDLLAKFQAGDHDMKLVKQAQDELREAVKADPNLLDAHKSLANVDEVLHDYDEAGKEYMAASALDPTDQKTRGKASYYRHLQQLTKQADTALDTIKSGDVVEGMSDLKAALQEGNKANLSKATIDHMIDDLRQGVAAVVQQADQQVQQQKYIDGMKTYDQAVRGYMLLALATKQEKLDPAVDAVIHNAGLAAQKGGPQASQMISALLNDVLTFDPDNKTANMELAQLSLHENPPDYSTAADLMERAGAPDAEVNKLRAEAKKHH
jgi:Tfp pilus assembly protein PilF